jgi:hypothetical protein
MHLFQQFMKGLVDKAIVLHKSSIVTSEPQETSKLCHSGRIHFSRVWAYSSSIDKMPHVLNLWHNKTHLALLAVRLCDLSNYRTNLRWVTCSDMDLL